MNSPALRLLHLTDTHLFAATDGRLRGVDTHRTLSRVLETALADPRPPDAILVTGDLAQDESPGAYANFRALLERPGLPVWCLPGNHENPGHMAQALSSPPFHVGGTLAQGQWRVLLVSSHVPGEHGGRVDLPQLRWLEAQLAEHHDRHVMIAIHHHLLHLGSDWLDELSLANAADVLALLDRSTAVRCVLAGHVHQASDQTRRGVRFLTTPSTCFQFLPKERYFAVDVRPPGFRWLDLQPDGGIDTAVVWVDQG